jgi:hypothetical protein
LAARSILAGVAADESDAQRLASKAAGTWREIKKEKGRKKKKARQSRAVRCAIPDQFRSIHFASFAI